MDIREECEMVVTTAEKYRTRMDRDYARGYVLCAMDSEKITVAESRNFIDKLWAITVID